jgi:hypothetical protein
MSCGNKAKDTNDFEGTETKNISGCLRDDETDTCFCGGIDLLLFFRFEAFEKKIAKIRPLTFHICLLESNNF